MSSDNVSDNDLSPQTGADPPSEDTTAPPVQDPERGLRGVFSAVLVLEAIAILLGLTVIANGGTSAPGWQIGVILALGFAHMLTPALIKRPWVLGLVAVLQALVVACWVIAPAIGITGVVFVIVWVLLLLMRREFRRRLAAGTMTAR